MYIYMWWLKQIKVNPKNNYHQETRKSGEKIIYNQIKIDKKTDYWRKSSLQYNKRSPTHKRFSMRK